MALVVKDRVKVYSSTTGTGTLSLGSAFAGFQTFNNALADGDTTYYGIFESSTGNWEVGLGTYTSSGNTLSRDTILESSNAGAAVNLTADTEVFITYPAEKSVYFDANGDVNLNRDPQSALQAATKQYVDTIAAAGLHYHAPVRVEHPSNLTATYDNGTSGVGATLTNSGTQAVLVLDNVTMVVSDRVLIANQTNQAHNGVYTVTNIGSASTNWVLTRATDADSYGPSDPDALGEGDAFFIKEGDTNAGHLDVMTTSGTITFGTTNIVFSEVAETTVYSAGNGLSLSGTEFNVGAGTGITVSATTVSTVQDIATSATPTFDGLNTTGDITFGDNDKAIFGAGSDLQIYHSGTHSFINDAGTGQLQIRSNGTGINLRTNTNEEMLTAETNGAVTLYYDNASKLATTSTGIDVTGNATFADNGKAIFGAGSDLQIYSDGANSIIQETDGTGNLLVRASNINLQNSGATATLAQFIDGGKSSLRYNGSEKLATTSTGIDVTGTVTADGLTVDGTIDLNIGTENVGIDISSTDEGSYILVNDNNATGFYFGARAGSFDLYDTNNQAIIKANSNGDISFYEDTGTTAKFFWDASEERLGVGTTSVSYPLDVRKNSTTDYVSSSTSQATPYVNGDSVISLTNATSTTDRGAFLSLGSTDAWGVTNLKYLGVVSQTGSYGGNFVIGGRTGSTSYNEHFRIDASGRVGIGTSSPSSYHANADNLVIQDSGNAGITIATTDSAYFSQINFADGTSGAQAYTGILRYAHSDNSLRIIVNTGEKMRIDSSGNVGINTNAPNAKLEVKTADLGGTAGDSEESLRLTTSNTNADKLVFTNERLSTGTTWVSAAHRIQRVVDVSKMGYIQFGSNSSDLITFGETTTERMRLDGDGNLGIGTNSPTEKLTVNGVLKTLDPSDNDNGHTLKSSITSDFSQHIFRDNQGSENKFIIAYGTSHPTTPSDIYIKNNEAFGGVGFVAGATERMKIEYDGNVGIGTSSPSSTLEVSKSDQTNGATFTITNAFSGGSWAVNDVIGTIDFKTDDASTTQLVRGRIQSITDDVTGTNWSYGTALAFSTAFNNTLSERMRIDRGGNVGIGTDSPSAFASYKYLDVAGSSSSQGGVIQVYTSGKETRAQWFADSTGVTLAGVTNHHFKFATNNTERMRIDSSGNLIVSKTATSWNTEGIVLFSDASASGSRIDVTTDGGTPLNLNRLTSDGEIAGFYKDGSQVGSIATEQGDLVIGTGDTGVKFNDALNSIYPYHTDISNGSQDNSIDIGYSTVRFKDLYLSGSLSDGTTSRTVADIVGLTSSQFLRSDASDTATGVVTFDNDSGINVVYSTSDTTNITGYGIISNRAAFYLRPTTDNSSTLYVGSSDASYDWSSIELKVGNNNNVNINGNTVWHAGNDGAGSGLDADLLDGQDGSYYTSFANVTSKTSGTGDFATTGVLQSGKGSGGVALTINDGGGNANVTFNHQARVPEQNGQCARIEVNTDNTTSGNAHMYFELGTGTSGVTLNLPVVFELGENEVKTYQPLNVTGAITATGDITAYFSDERLKDFDGKIDGALDKVSQLNGYYYRENDKAKELGFENDDRQVGVSAQEVEAVLPEVIKPAPVDPEYKTVQYEKLVPLLIEAIKELKEEVRQLKEDKA